MLQLLLALVLIVAVFVAVKRGVDVRGLVAAIVVVDVLGLAVDSSAATMAGYGLSVLTLIYIVCAALGMRLPRLWWRR